MLLAIGLLFHLWLEYSLNIPLFQWDILSGYILFVDVDDLARMWSKLRRRPAGGALNSTGLHLASMK